jgi:hypothetical protein
MKKLILTAIGLVAGATLIHAQGYIEFYGPSAAIGTNSASTYGNGGASQGKLLGTAGQYDFALLYATTTTAGDASPLGANWSLVTLDAGGALLGNNFAGDAGGLTGPGTSGGVQVDLAAGTTYEAMLVGWSATLGSSWSQVSSLFTPGTSSTIGGFIGNTPIETMTPFSTAGAGDPVLFTSVFPAGSLVLDAVPVPEPATLALAGLGGLSMLFLRRRKS